MYEESPLPPPLQQPWTPTTGNLLTNLTSKGTTRLDEYLRLRMEGYSDATVIEWWGAGDRGRESWRALCLMRQKRACREVFGAQPKCNSGGAMFEMASAFGRVELGEASLGASTRQGGIAEPTLLAVEPKEARNPAVRDLSKGCPGLRNAPGA